jgi:hypothetical protein
LFSSAQVRQACWDGLKRLEAFDDVPREWNDTFRVDPYGEKTIAFYNGR